MFCSTSPTVSQHRASANSRPSTQSNPHLKLTLLQWVSLHLEGRVSYGRPGERSKLEWQPSPGKVCFLTVSDSSPNCKWHIIEETITFRVQWQTHTSLLKYTLGTALNYPHCSPSSEVRKPKQKWVVPGHILNRNTHSLQRELDPSEFKTFLSLFPLEVLFSALALYSFFPTTKRPSPLFSPSTISSLALLPSQQVWCTQHVFFLFCLHCPFTLTILQLGSAYHLVPLSAPRNGSPHCYL